MPQHFHEQPKLYSADLTGCRALSSLSTDEIRTAFTGALMRAGATVVETVAHEFPGTGLTCTLILAESHATLHTWPETGTVNLDIFSCSTRLKSLAAIDEIARSLDATNTVIQETPRADGHRPLVGTR